MEKKRVARIASRVMSACLLGSGAAAAESPQDEARARLEALERQIAEQTERLEALQRAMAQEQRRLLEVREALGLQVLEAQRGGQGQGSQSPSPTAQAPAPAPAAAQPTPVGQAPESDSRPQQVAQIFEQPGVLTPRGRAVIEPSLQYSYSSANRVALVGYTIIPAITIGVIDVREVKRSTLTATLTGRYGLTNRMEVEARLPYVYRSDDSIGTELGANPDAPPGSSVFNADGHGIGDVEITGRYQLNDGGLDKPYLIGSLRYKSRTGKDPFEVLTVNGIQGLRDGVQTELPRGSGFHGLQPALTVLFPSDPAVFFGTVSYLHSFSRSNIAVPQQDGGTATISKVRPGGIFGFNFGMGLALNEKSSLSLGYDHSIVGKTRIEGATGAPSVRTQLGTLLLGYSYRLGPTRSLNVSLGVGATRDTPDVTLTVRIPTNL